MYISKKYKYIQVIGWMVICMVCSMSVRVVVLVNGKVHSNYYHTDYSQIKISSFTNTKTLD